MARWRDNERSSPLEPMKAGTDRVGHAVSTPNELLAAIERRDWAAVDATPTRIWWAAQAIAECFDHAQHCAMRRGDHEAREMQLAVMSRWQAVEAQAVWLDERAELISL